jgi:hypothetical protein
MFCFRLGFLIAGFAAYAYRFDAARRAASSGVMAGVGTPGKTTAGTSGVITSGSGLVHEQELMLKINVIGLRHRLQYLPRPWRIGLHAANESILPSKPCEPAQ